MIGKVSVPRGRRCEPLIWYLYGPGRHNEHTDPHIVAGWRDPAELEPPLRPDGRRDFRRLTGLLRQPHDALGDRAHDRPVWHCSVRAAPGDRMLSDAEWAQVAADVMDRTGLSPRGQDEDAVRWIAIRHAPDHVHLVALLARQDGRKAFVHRDFFQVGAACRAAEERYGLTETDPPDKTASRHPSRAESEKAARQGRAVPARVTLRQHVAGAAAASASEAEFFARLQESGVTVRARYSTRDPDQVTGYAVSLPGDLTRDGQPVWYSGGKLAPDLTLPRLRARWEPGQADQADRSGPSGPDQRSAIWDQADRTARSAVAAIRADPAAAGDIAWAAGDFLRGCAAALGSPDLAAAADTFARAAREQYGRIPPPAPAGAALRTAARALYAIASAGGTRASRQNLRTLITMLQVIALVEQIAQLREAQRRRAQCAASWSAARQVRAAHAAVRAGAAVAGHAPCQPGQAAAQRTAALGFPAGPADGMRQPGAAPPPAARRAPRPGPGRQPRGRAP